MMSKAICISLALIFALLGFTQQAHAARLVKVRVYVDEVIILEGSTSDDGSPDADVAWNYLREIQLKPTKEFETFVDRMKVNDHSLELSATGRITVSYGGRKEFRKAFFKISKDEKGAAQYRLNSELVDKWFDSRLITRREAAGLVSPQLK